MYIPYEKIAQTIALLIPYRFRKGVKKLGYQLKVKANCTYIKKNIKKVQKKLSKEARKRKLKVGFLVFDETKWKCQSLYELFDKSENFSPVVLVSKKNAPKNSANFEDNEHIKQVYNFFKNKNLKTEYAYDIVNDSFIPLKNFDLDIIFYQEPWYIETTQGPVVNSLNSLTYYVPYYLPNTTLECDYNLRFHRYVNKYYVLNEHLKKRYTSLMQNKGENLVAVGSPQLDYFYFNKNNKVEKNSVIFAPHWSIDHKNNKIAYSTFLWSGEIILDFAKQHPELNWVFKPHPLLKNNLLITKSWSKEKTEDYWKQWENLGKGYYSGDYLNLFEKSNAMITDCGSFLTEYFMTKNPVIRLISPDSVECYSFVEKIASSYYCVNNEVELKECLNSLLINKIDPKKDERLRVYNELDFTDKYCAQDILNDIKKELRIE